MAIVDRLREECLKTSLRAPFFRCPYFHRPSATVLNSLVPCALPEQKSCQKTAAANDPILSQSMGATRVVRQLGAVCKHDMTSSLSVSCGTPGGHLLFCAHTHTEMCARTSYFSLVHVNSALAQMIRHISDLLYHTILLLHYSTCVVFFISVSSSVGAAKNVCANHHSNHVWIFLRSKRIHANAFYWPKREILIKILVYASNVGCGYVLEKESFKYFSQTYQGEFEWFAQFRTLTADIWICIFSHAK